MAARRRVRTTKRIGKARVVRGPDRSRAVPADVERAWRSTKNRRRMRMNPRTSQALALAMALFLLSAQGVLAQGYPTRPVRLVAASAPGGTSDILARLLAQQLTTELGQQF